MAVMKFTVIQNRIHIRITNKLLSKKTDAICVAYENLERFSKDKMVTGNPVRQDLIDIDSKRSSYRVF
jgi:UDP-N-acetylglucosamine--N-acetylmuramyl-(pentapeptide) pyrophosphoryl-undecaprenol N-acetylglucosamine transferase